MPKTKMKPRMVGVELYFDDLDRAKKFYRQALGLRLTGGSTGQIAQFDAGAGFLCLERKGAENYPSLDKAVVFFEVPDLAAAVRSLGRAIHPDEPGRVIRYVPRPEPPRSRRSSSAARPWAVLHDPEGHNILLLESSKRKRRKRA
jgi:catechol 2,3-dioxygenase-like lactoylglutathione lyase family enzyme